MTAWMYQGTTEGNNPIIQSWIDQLNNEYGYPDKEGNSPIDNDSGEWCGVFVYKCLKDSGISINRKKGAWQSPALSSFYQNNWKGATILDNPEIGAIVRMKYSHVAFIIGFDDKYLWIIGGNQQPEPALEDGRGTTVNIRKVKRSQKDKYVSPIVSE
jgi:hypothetical protein